MNLDLLQVVTEINTWKSVKKYTCFIVINLKYFLSDFMKYVHVQSWSPFMQTTCNIGKLGFMGM